jgi:nitrogen fixation/metabolism regulation signal transduction histidine kinase
MGLTLINTSQTTAAQNELIHWESLMKLLQDLFGTDYGAMSLIVIVIAIVMPIYISRWVKRQIEESEKNAQK